MLPSLMHHTAIGQGLTLFTELTLSFDTGLSRLNSFSEGSEMQKINCTAVNSDDTFAGFFLLYFSYLKLPTGRIVG